MSFKDWKDSFLGNLRRGQSDMDDQTVSSMPNGGYTGYRPQQNQTRRNYFTQGMQAAQGQQGDGHSGLTDMLQGVPGSPYDAPRMNEYPAQQQAPVQDPARQYTQGVGGYPQQGQFPPQQPQYTQQQPGMQPPYMQQPGPYTQQQPGMQGQYTQQQQQDSMMMRFTSRLRRNHDLPNQQPAQPLTPQMPQTPPQAPQQPPQPMESNISYINTEYRTPDGKAYRNVIRVTQVSSVQNCYRVIEIMRDGEVVIVNTESIASDAEVQRCLDMLVGAAFTLRCSMTKLSQHKRLYLLAPESVMVVEVSNSYRNEPAPSARRGEQSVNSQFPRRQEYPRSGEGWAGEQPITFPQTVQQQTAYQQPVQQTAYQQPVPQTAQQTGYRQPVQVQPRTRYESDTRRGTYGVAPSSGMNGISQ